MYTYPKFSCVSVSKGVGPAVSDSFDEVWDIRNEVERSFFRTIYICCLVCDTTILSTIFLMHLEKLPVWCSSISSTCYYLRSREEGRDEERRREREIKLEVWDKRENRVLYIIYYT